MKKKKYNKEKRNIKKKSKIIPILIAIIIVLILGLIVEAYMLRLTVLELNDTENMYDQLKIDKQELTSDLDVLQQKYNLLHQAVQKASCNINLTEIDNN